MLIGLVCGIAMVLVTEMLENKGIDDPVGAFAVHGASGSLGTLAVGLFAMPSMTKGVGQEYAGLFYGGGWNLLWRAGVRSRCRERLGLRADPGLSFLLIKRIMPVRVSKDEELIGLDVGIHGVPAYNQDHDFLDVDQLKTRG